jgi:hypothetical protein
VATGPESDQVACGPLTGEWDVWWPDASSSPFEAELVASNQAGWARSREVLGRFIPDLGFLDVLNHRSTRLSVDASVARQLVDRQFLEVALSHVDGSPGSIGVHHGMAKISMDAFLAATTESFAPGALVVNRLLFGLRTGYTFNLIGTDRRSPVLGQLAEHFERLIGGAVEIGVFLSSGGSPSTPFHADAPELLVIPVRGPKRWEVRRAATAYPRLGDESLASGDVAFAGVLVVGDALSVPRAWIHRAEPCEEFSICLTVGFHRGVAAAPVVSCVNSAAEDPELRRPLAVTAATDRAGFDAAVRSGMATLDRLVEPRRRLDAIARELASIVNRVTGPPVWPLAGASWAGDATRWGDRSSMVVQARHGGGVYPARRRGGTASPGRIALAVARRVVDLPEEWMTVAVRCLAGVPASFDELTSGVPGSDQLVLRLLVEGLLEVVDADAMSFDRLVHRPVDGP